MIVVHTVEEVTDCDGASRFSTDEHNNLCIFEGKSGDRLRLVVNASQWVKVVVEDDDQG